MRWSALCRSELNDRFSLQYSRQLAEPIVPAPPADAREARPAKGGAIVDLKVTMLALPISAELREQHGRLPFKPPTPGNEFARTMKVWEHNPKQGQTTPIGDDSIEKAVAALPFAGNKVGAGVVPLPRLSIGEYASLRAELASWPERSGEILRRYRVVNEAARRALEEHWGAELSASPEARSMFEEELGPQSVATRAEGVARAGARSRMGYSVNPSARHHLVHHVRRVFVDGGEDPREVGGEAQFRPSASRA